MTKEKWCKTALTPSKLPGINYSLNPYSGCAHACKYCYVPNVI
ncbi:MAG TPA: radical SAM protein, partial [Thermoplasmatales archaeon]|nr:radical SAM protein [Thermoplasmatales archaeon]